MGCHIDGYIAQLGHTLVVGQGEERVWGKKGEVILAARKGLEAAIRLVKA